MFNILDNIDKNSSKNLKKNDNNSKYFFDEKKTS